MADVVFMDGFDVYDSSNINSTRPSIHSKWVVTSANNMTFPAGRFGGRCAAFGTTVYSNNIKGFFANNTTYQYVSAGLAIQIGDVANFANNNLFLALTLNNSDQIGLVGTGIGQISLIRGNTTLATSLPNLVKTRNWHYVEIEWAGNTTSGRATVYLDGVQIINYVGNTQAQTAYGCNGVRLYSGGGTELLIDDLYVINEATRLGERRIETLRPNGDVQLEFAPSTGTTGFATLNEELVSATQYNSSSVLNAKDIFNFTNLSNTPSVIDAVQLNVWATKTDTETRQIATILKSGTVENTSSNYQLPINHTCLNRVINKNPENGQAWTLDSVNAIQGGYKITQ